MTNKNGRVLFPSQPVSVVVIFHNDAEHVAETVSRLQSTIEAMRWHWPIELVLIDDGSTDATWARLHEQAPRLQRFACRMRHLETSRGFGAALRAGAEMTTGWAICTLDGSCTFPPEELSKLIRILALSGCDIVTGSPYHPVLSRAKNAAPRRLSKWASRIYRVLTPIKLYSYSCFFRAYRRECLAEHMPHSDSYLGVTENLIDLAYQGATIIEYPIALSKIGYGKNTRQTLAVIWEHLRLIRQVLWKKLVPGARRLPRRAARAAADVLQTAAAGDALAAGSGGRVLSGWALTGRRVG